MTDPKPTGGIELLGAFDVLWATGEDGIPVIHINTPRIPENADGPICRIYLNDADVHLNPDLPELELTDEQGAAWIPETPGGTLLTHLEADTEDEAWEKLLYEARHMPYDGISGFKDRGYSVGQWFKSKET